MLQPQQNIFCLFRLFRINTANIYSCDECELVNDRFIRFGSVWCQQMPTIVSNSFLANVCWYPDQYRKAFWQIGLATITHRITQLLSAATVEHFFFHLLLLLLLLPLFWVHNSQRCTLSAVIALCSNRSLRTYSKLFLVESSKYIDSIEFRTDFP